MNYKNIFLLSAGLALASCGQQGQTELETGFQDDVKTALSNGGSIDINSLQWTREPGGFEVKGDTILITTAPHTDLWHRTYYHFRTTMRQCCK